MNRQVILFGVERYDEANGLRPLVCPANDVAKLEEMYASPDHGGDPDHVHAHANLTYRDAEHELFAFLEGLTKDDVAVIHFSGHGMQDESGDLYLCFTDSHVDKLAITALGTDRLRKLLDNSRARRVLITWDCCYSGAAGDQLARDHVSVALEQMETPANDGTGIYVLSASGETETAKESKELGTGVFTHHLIQGVVTGAADRDGDGDITVSEIAEYLQTEVPKHAARQRPHLTAHKVSGSFVVARNHVVVLQKKIGTYRECLKSFVDQGVFTFLFVAGPDEWLKNEAKGAPASDPRWDLLDRLSSKELTAGDFQVAWVNLGKEAAEPVADHATVRRGAARVQPEPKEMEAEPKPTGVKQPPSTEHGPAVPKWLIWCARLIPLSVFLQIWLFIENLVYLALLLPTDPTTHEDFVYALTHYLNPRAIAVADGDAFWAVYLVTAAAAVAVLRKLRLIGRFKVVTAIACVLALAVQPLIP